MTSNRLKTQAMLRRAVHLAKQSNEFQLSSSFSILSMNSNRPRQSTSSNPHFETVPTMIFSPFSFGTTFNFSSQKKYDFYRAEKLLEQELNRRCSKVSKLIRYDPNQCLELIREFSQQLRRILRSDQLNSVRYKIVVLVSIVQLAPDRQRHQAVTVVSRCLWDKDTDGSITAQAPLGLDMNVIATAYLLYTE